MSTEIKSKDDADRALDLLLAGDSVNDETRRRMRIAYLFGRTDQAADNLDRLIKSIKGDAEKSAVPTNRR